MQATLSRSVARRSSVQVRASAQPVDRRAFLGLVAAGAAALFAAPKAAEAIRIPSQEFTGGMVTGGGSSPKSATAASMSSFDMEGTKKQGISPKKRKSVLSKARASAEKKAAAKK